MSATNIPTEAKKMITISKALRRRRSIGRILVETAVLNPGLRLTSRPGRTEAQLLVRLLASDQVRPGQTREEWPDGASPSRWARPVSAYRVPRPVSSPAAFRNALPGGIQRDHERREAHLIG